MKTILSVQPNPVIVLIAAGLMIFLGSRPSLSQDNLSVKRKDDVCLRTGYWPTRADASWQTSFSSKSGSCISRLKYHDLDADLLSIEVDILHYAPAFGLNLLFAAAPINNGRSQDTDYENSRRLSESKNPVDGRVDLWSLEGRITLPFGTAPHSLRARAPRLSPAWHWQGILGIQHYQDSLRMFSTRPLPTTSRLDSQESRSAQDNGPIANREQTVGWLNSYYHFSWDAIKIGLKSTWNLTHPLIPLCHSLEIEGKVTPLLTHYLGTGIWNLEDDFAQNPSFHHKAYGYGVSAELSLIYHPWAAIGFELGWQYLWLAADGGTDITYYYSGEKGKSNLDEVRLLRQGVFVKSAIYF